MLNGNPSLKDITLPMTVDAEVAFWTGHSEYALRNFEPDSWYLYRIDRRVPRVTHFLYSRGAEWIASPVDRGRTVHAPDWRNALRRVVS